jgi:transcriptional regulator with XRE-family HTH domain
MTRLIFDQLTPAEVAANVAQRVRQRRKEHGLSQAEMSRKAGMSLGSYKRFEQQHEISFTSLVKIAIALDCENDFEQLFSKRHYRSILEVIDERASKA